MQSGDAYVYSEGGGDDMDHQKTGTLIAQRRHQLNLTQKELADRLNISDRTISKWERGLGFPDISLIEPLADALGLTVLELLHGQEVSPLPNEEQTVRETLQVLRPEVEGKIGRARRWNRLLAVLLIVTVMAAVVFGIGILREEQGTVEISAAEATAISPYILVTSQDIALMEALYQDEAVVNSFVSDTPLITLEDETTAQYQEIIDAQGLELSCFIVQISAETLHVEYGTDLMRIMLDYNADRIDGSVEKTVVQLSEPYPYLEGEYGGIPNPQYG